MSEGPDDRNDTANGLPTEESNLLKALRWDAEGHWDKAHDLVAAEATRAAARVHAYLHRKEGDVDNARYWYASAGERPFTGSLEQEWRDLVRDISGQGP